MQFNTLFFLLSLSCLYLALAHESYEDCCLKHVKELNMNTRKHAVMYRQQETDGACNIPAIVFIMRKGRVFCANPRENWVIDLMKTIDNKAKNRKNKPSRKHHSQLPRRG
ncbi:C-C motif chemokine 25 [Mastacembelus armatus]|uniref:Chemokine (C-C motif) ligand 25a n=1 Tax=Mastacembelus armatus TaxID=205130 RepID=A0A3Q3L3A4_9TELE|nr:C-C motif chemokine 25-like [Mastacembelus armatus]